MKRVSLTLGFMSEKEIVQSLKRTWAKIQMKVCQREVLKRFKTSKN